jgi:mRNA-degrading endonuclease YafQ of YafQ-DinJ toxin-antitoxin module
MSTQLSVLITNHFEREYRKLEKKQPRLPRHYAEVLEALKADPYNRTHAHPIKKLESVPGGSGQYRSHAR